MKSRTGQRQKPDGKLPKPASPPHSGKLEKLGADIAQLRVHLDRLVDERARQPRRP